MSCINTLIEAVCCIHYNINLKGISLWSGPSSITAVWVAQLYFPESQLHSSSLVSDTQPSRHLRQRSPCDSHHGIIELFGGATFGIKPLSHTQNALLACASRGDVTLQHEKLLRESELNESASLSVCWPIAQRSLRDNYSRVDCCYWWRRDGENGNTAVLKAFLTT